MDPAGNYLYVANALSNSISAFSIAASSGVLTAVAGSPFQINLSPKGMQLSPSGSFLYVSAPSSPTGVIAVFSVTAGVLSSSPVGLTSTADNDPAGIAISPNGSYLYTANSTANSISIYSIGSSGTLTQVPQSPLADPFQHPVALIVDPTGNYLYVTNQGSSNISTYSITSGTVFLSQLPTRRSAPKLSRASWCWIRMANIYMWETRAGPQEFKRLVSAAEA
jgi:6-phosphogluconolactonase